MIESTKLVSPTVFGSNTAAQLESDARARAAAADQATYGFDRYKADLKQCKDEAEIDQWYLDENEEFAAREEEKAVCKRQQQAELAPPPPPPRHAAHLPSGTVPSTLASPVYQTSHTEGAQEWPAVPTFEFAARLTNKKAQADFFVWALTGVCDPVFAHLLPWRRETDATPVPTAVRNEAPALVAQQLSPPPFAMRHQPLLRNNCPHQRSK